MLYKRVNGPYVHNTGRLKGRKYVNIVYNDGHKGSKLYSRYLMEMQDLNLGGLTIDHKDEDFTNDAIENLQPISIQENIKKFYRLRRPRQTIEFNCPACGILTSKPKNYVISNRKQGKAGPYCSRRCAGKTHN